MTANLLYQEEMFVVLESDQPEVFLTTEELGTKLQTILEKLPPEMLPRPLQKLATIPEKAVYLRDNFCDLALEGDRYLEWYVVRLEK
ncbi:MAG: chlororespiratory reduction protein 7 [Microcystaceae cyanobacterium]